MHSCLTCTSVCRQTLCTESVCLHQTDAGGARLPAGPSLQAPGSLGGNKQTQPGLDKHKHANATHDKETQKTVKCLELATEFIFNTAGHMTAAGVSGEGEGG